jgi:7-carboxy-7-deazaguanine synthase
MNTLPVMESFYSLQGEGIYNGAAAYFIRLAGCDVGCSWCDVKESWEAGPHQQVNLDELVGRAIDSGTNFVVITGGEPLMYNLNTLTAKLQGAGLKTHLETSGAYPFSGSWDWICVSPKKFRAPLPEVLRQANELKIIVVNRHDFTWASQHESLVPATAHKLLQPEWEKSAKILPEIINYVKDNPQWRVSLQQHKLMNIP